MPITQASLVNATTAGNLVTKDTASITPTANRLVIASISNQRVVGGTASEPTLSGNSLTWVMAATTSTGARRISILRTMGESPTSGAVTISFGTNSQAAVGWSIYEFAGIDTTGTNGSGAVVQAASAAFGSGTGLVITLQAFGAASNGATSAFTIGDNIAITPDTGWTEIADLAAGGASEIETQWRDNEDTTAYANWGAGNSNENAGVAIEIKLAAVAAEEIDQSYVISV